MFRGRTELWVNGSRYVICDRMEAERLGGALDRTLAECVLSHFVGGLGTDSTPLRKLYAELTNSFDMRLVRDQDVVAFFLRELGVGTYNAAFSRYALVEVGVSAQARGEARTEAQEVVRSLERELRDQDLRHHADDLRLVTAGDATQDGAHVRYQQLATNEAHNVLTMLASDVRIPERVRVLLGRALPLVAPVSGSSQERIVVLRRQRAHSWTAPADAPAAPVSAKRKPPPPKRDWIEFQFVDDAGKPMANERYEVQLADGSMRSGQLDARGNARLSDVPEGDCLVSFPAFKPKLAS